MCGAFAAEQAALEAEISAAKTCEPLANCNSHHCMQDGFLGDGLRLAVGEECSFVGNFVEVNMEVHWTPTAEELAGTATTNAQSAAANAEQNRRRLLTFKPKLGGKETLKRGRESKSQKLLR